MVNANDPGIAASVYLVHTLPSALDSTFFCGRNSLGDERRLAQNREQNGEVQRRSPYPKARVLAVVLQVISAEDETRERKEHDTVVEGIADPVEERHGREEVVLLPELVQLRVSVEHSGRDELVEDTDNEGWEDREDDVVVGHRPAFEGDLAGEVVEPRVLA